MWPDSLDIPVSCETSEKLEVYHALLLKWQPAVNLVSPSTVPEAWVRHFADSAQIVRYIPEGPLQIADLGSGAGFPGLVLAMMRPDLDVHLIESDERKAEFLRTVSRETQTPVTVHADRLVRMIDKISPDLVTARALAELRKLLIYVEPWAQKKADFVALFMKGAKADLEIQGAQKSFHFHVEAFPSITDAQARILKITAIADKKISGGKRQT